MTLSTLAIICLVEHSQSSEYEMVSHCGFFFIYICYLFIWLHQDLSCGMWDLVPWPGIEPGLPALGASSLSHWTNREVSHCSFDLYFPNN